MRGVAEKTAAQDGVSVAGSQISGTIYRSVIFMLFVTHPPSDRVYDMGRQSETKGDPGDRRHGEMGTGFTLLPLLQDTLPKSLTHYLLPDFYQIFLFLFALSSPLSSFLHSAVNLNDPQSER